MCWFHFEVEWKTSWHPATPQDNSKFWSEECTARTWLTSSECYAGTTALITLTCLDTCHSLWALVQHRLMLRMCNHCQSVLKKAPIQVSRLPRLSASVSGSIQSVRWETVLFGRATWSMKTCMSPAPCITATAIETWNHESLDLSGLPGMSAEELKHFLSHDQKLKWKSYVVCLCTFLCLN